MHILNNMSKWRSQGEMIFFVKESIPCSGIFKFKKSLNLKKISERWASPRHELWRETKAKWPFLGRGISGGHVRGCTCVGESGEQGIRSHEF